MFFLLCVAAMCGYSISGVFLAHMSRTMESLSAVVYRHTALFLCLLPSVLFFPAQETMAVSEHWVQFVIIGIFGAIAVFAIFKSYQYFPVALSTAVRSIFNVPAAIIWAFLFFGEFPAWAAIGFMVVILSGGVILALQRVDVSHLPHQNVLRGVLWNALFAVLAALTFVLATDVSRSTNGVITALFWETSIGIIAGMVALMRWLWNGQTLHPMSLRQFGILILGIAPAAGATASLAVAMKMGSVSVASAILTGGVFVQLLLSWYFFGEKINQWQFAAICIIVVGVSGLRVYS